MSGLISIITTSFFSEKTIIDTLRSVNNQDYPHIEHIIIDGGSEDNTLDIVKEYGERVEYLVSERDEGIFDAYNKGIKASQGEIIGILNSDDFYQNSGVISQIMELFKNPSVDMVYGDLIYVKRDETSKVVRYWKSKVYSNGDFENGFMPAHPTFFCRRSVYDKVGNYDKSFRFAGDYDFLLRAFKVYGMNSFYLPKILVKMRDGGTTGGGLTSIKKQNLEILRSLSENNVDIYHLKFFVGKIFDRAKQIIRAKLILLKFKKLDDIKHV